MDLVSCFCQSIRSATAHVDKLAGLCGGRDDFRFFQNAFSVLNLARSLSSLAKDLLSKKQRFGLQTFFKLQCIWSGERNVAF